jgi:hypothetical protein
MPKERIIVMMEDDIAFSPYNPLPGKVFSLLLSVRVRACYYRLKACILESSVTAAAALNCADIQLSTLRRCLPRHQD